MILVKIFLHNNIKRLILQLNKITMKNSIKIFFSILLIILFSFCRTNVTKEQTHISSNGNIHQNPTSVAINKSIESAKIEEIIKNENGDVVIKAFILKVDEDPSYPSLAIAGTTYNLTPSFQLDEGKKIIRDSDKNKNLLLLTSQKPGYEFQAEIFFENLNGWFIQEVILN